MTVREIVKELGLSQEHRDRFLTPNTDTDAVKVCYKHFLARAPDAQGLQYWTQQAESQAGWPSLIRNLIDSEEYTRRFGDDTVPA